MRRGGRVGVMGRVMIRREERKEDIIGSKVIGRIRGKGRRTLMSDRTNNFNHADRTMFNPNDH